MYNVHGQSIHKAIYIVHIEQYNADGVGPRSNFFFLGLDPNANAADSAWIWKLRTTKKTRAGKKLESWKSEEKT